jgi:CRISPR-associated protein Cmr3
MMEYFFIEPIDVLYLRGNRLFGEAGDHAEALMPPWPSVFAGALRSRMLVDEGIDLARFLKDGANGGPLGPVLGSLDRPGSFRVAHVAVARRESTGPINYFPCPEDLVVLDEAPGGKRVNRMIPVDGDVLSPLVMDLSLPRLPVLRVAEQEKPASYWLTQSGLENYLQGTTPPPEAFVKTTDLWLSDPRLGIALDADARTAEKGRIYTTDTVAPGSDTGFIVGVAGADGCLPKQGLLRLGGDGRGAKIEPWQPTTRPPWEKVPSGPRFRMILATPGLFPNGWLPPGVERTESGELAFQLHELKARLVAASIPRSKVVSGWDVAREDPKPAQRMVPPGAVYWFEIMAGDSSVLQEIADEGLWPLVDLETLGSLWRQRKAEGFNNVWFGDWPESMGGSRR